MEKNNQKIVPNLWFDNQAKEAAEFYVSVFGNGSKVNHISQIHDTPSGSVDIVTFDVWGHSFMAISAGPLFKLNPSISFMVNFDPSQPARPDDAGRSGGDKDAKARIDEIWNKLADGGKILMPIDKYPFSERYGWVQDKFGLSWQLILTKPEGEERPLIIPSLLFVGGVCGKAEEASNFYLSLFENWKLKIYWKLEIGNWKF